MTIFPEFTNVCPEFTIEDITLVTNFDRIETVKEPPFIVTVYRSGGKEPEELHFITEEARTIFCLELEEVRKAAGFNPFAA
jgi:hypothetical protein